MFSFLTSIPLYGGDPCQVPCRGCCRMLLATCCVQTPDRPRGSCSCGPCGKKLSGGHRAQRAGRGPLWGPTPRWEGSCPPLRCSAARSFLQGGPVLPVALRAVGFGTPRRPWLCVSLVGAISSHLTVAALGARVCLVTPRRNLAAVKLRVPPLLSAPGPAGERRSRASMRHIGTRVAHQAALARGGANHAQLSLFLPLYTTPAGRKRKE